MRYTIEIQRGDDAGGGWTPILVHTIDETALARQLSRAVALLRLTARRPWRVRVWIGDPMSGDEPVAEAYSRRC